MTRGALALAACFAVAACAQNGGAPRPPIPEGGMRITRVTDPVTVCTIITASTLGGVTLGRASTGQAGDQTTVTWRGSRVDNRAATVSCRLDRAAQQVTSVTVDGAERLSAPAPY